MLALGMVIAAAQTPTGVLGAPPSLTLDPALHDQNRWLVVGPLSKAVDLTLSLEGSEFRTKIDLPIVSGAPATWVLPLDSKTRQVSLTGGWEPTAKVLTTARKAPASSVDLLISATTEADGHPGFRFDFPAWTIAPGFSAQLSMNVLSSGGWRVDIGQGGTEKTFLVPAGTESWNYSPQVWGVQPRTLTITPRDRQDPAFRVVSLKPVGITPETPLPADTATLLAWPQKSWRDPRREWFSWSSAPGVLVVVTQDYRVQDDYFKRLAFFVEKAGYRGRLVPDFEMEGQHGWNAHDYQAVDLARFFSLAAGQGFPLNDQELELRDRLVGAGVLRQRDASTWEAGEGAVLGISLDSPPALRAFLFTHEAFHGLYFTSSDFRDGVSRIWGAMAPSTQQHFRDFLALSQYDPNDEPLMVNEFQAYSLQQGSGAWAGYFASRILTRKPPLREAEKTQALADLLSAAREVDALVKHLFGVTAGDVRTVLPVLREKKE